MTPRDQRQFDGLSWWLHKINPVTIITAACNMMPKVASRTWKLGTRVVIEEVQNECTKHLNGQTGVVSKHRRHGHPAFVRKPSSPDTPQLVLCIAFDNPEVAGKRSMLLAPRFLKAL